MASRTVIRVTISANADGTLTHQIRNLGEDIYRAVETEGLGTLGGLSAVDTTAEGLEISVFKASMVGSVLKIVNRQLKRHLLVDRAAVSLH